MTLTRNDIEKSKDQLWEHYNNKSMDFQLIVVLFLMLLVEIAQDILFMVHKIYSKQI